MSLPNEVISGLLASSAKDEDSYQVSRSLRFNSADFAYLSRTPASAGNRKTWTWSGWVKKSQIQAASVLISPFFGSMPINGSAPYDYFGFYQDTLYFSFASALRLQTSALYRDVSSWYHIVISVDTTQATDTNRFKMYVNGSQITSFTTASYPAQNTDSAAWNTTSQNNIGVYNNGINNFANMYMAQVHFIDGQALTPTSFAESDANGRWVPKAYTGTYGTNGFYLKFADNSGTTATTLGKDSSPNGNNWTPNNLSVTAGVGNDSLVDSPTNYGTDTGLGGEVRGNYATLDPLTPIGSASGLSVLNNSNLQLTYPSSSYSQRFANFRMNFGKWYYEWTLVNVGYPGLQCGWHSSVSYPALTGSGGLATGGSAAGYFTGPDIWVNTYTGGFGVTTFAGTAWAANDIIGVAIDIDAGKFWVSRNGTWYQSGNPSSGTNPLDTWTPNSDLYFAPWFVLYGTTTNTYANFGQRPFAYTAPTGFKTLNTQNLPTPAIKNPSKYMNIATYTGTGATRSITGVGFQPDLVWTKSRSNAETHKLVDSVRGATKALSSETTGDEVTESGLTSFDTDGFTINGTTDTGYNTNTYTYVGWAWKKGVTPGFDIVNYTGTGVARTISHSLGAVPHFMIVKARTTASTDQGWPVYHRDLTSASYYVPLGDGSTSGQTSLSTVWNGTAPTSSVFSVGTNALTNTNNDTYVAYLWNEVSGFSRFGTYTGNGSTDGPFVWCGFRPKYVLLKPITIADNWRLSDSARNPYNVIDGNNGPGNNAASAVNVAYYMDYLSNGFKIRASGQDRNASGVKYIFAAFAEAPFKYSRGR